MFSTIRPDVVSAFYAGEVVIAAGDVVAEVEFQKLLEVNRQSRYFSDVGDAVAEMADRVGCSAVALSAVRDGFVGVVEFGRLDNRLPDFGFYFYVADVERVRGLLPSYCPVSEVSEMGVRVVPVVV